MTSHRMTGMFAAAAGLCLLIAAGACRKGADRPEAREEFLAAAPVKAVRATRDTISERLKYTGTVEARKSITINPDVGGKIARIHVQEGDRVSRGQILAELETEALRLQLNQAEAGTAVAEAGFNDALKNKERMDRLLKENAVSDQQHEKVHLAYEAAEAQRRQAQAALSLARHALDVSIMRAPFDGIVTSKNAEVGDVINPMMGGSGPASGVLTLVDFAQVKIAVEAIQTDALRLHTGQAASLTVSYAPGTSFPGEISVVNPAADPATKKFKVEVIVDNPDGVVRPGTFGEVFFEVTTHENALVVPQRAVMENAYVFVIENGRAVRRPVSLGLENSHRVEILSGLVEGEWVIVEGNFGLEEGTPVVLEEGRS